MKIKSLTFIFGLTMFCSVLGHASTEKTILTGKAENSVVKNIVLSQHHNSHTLDFKKTQSSLLGLLIGEEKQIKSSKSDQEYLLEVLTNKPKSKMRRQSTFMW